MHSYPDIHSFLVSSIIYKTKYLQYSLHNRNEIDDNEENSEERTNYDPCNSRQSHNRKLRHCDGGLAMIPSWCPAKKVCMRYFQSLFVY